MTRSKSLIKFAETHPEVHTNPQKYLGPNYEKVLDFWKKLDGLTEEQWKVVNERAWSSFDNDCFKWLEARTSTFGVMNRFLLYFDVRLAVYFVTSSKIAIFATFEIIGDVPNKVFLSMFDDL